MTKKKIENLCQRDMMFVLRTFIHEAAWMLTDDLRESSIADYQGFWDFPSRK